MRFLQLVENTRISGAAALHRPSGKVFGPYPTHLQAWESEELGQLLGLEGSLADAPMDTVERIFDDPDLLVDGFLTSDGRFLNREEAAKAVGYTKFPDLHAGEVDDDFGPAWAHVTEATRPFTEKVVDPALMTFQEYHEFLNPHDKNHPSTAYQTSVEDLNQYQSPEKYPRLINTITRHGLSFEVREKQIDRWDGQFVKTTPDGEIVRGEDGRALYMSQDEVEEMIPAGSRFRYEYAVVDKQQQKIVGDVGDEWGALLVRVAQEYRRFGFGPLLVRLAREKRPDWGSGGLTPEGKANLRRVHAEHVREYLSSGFYSYLVRQGTITAERVKQIVASIPERKQHQQRNLNTRDPKDWLIMSDGQSFVIVYDRKLFQIDEPDDEGQQYWAERFIIGMASLGHYGTDLPPFVNRTYGRDQIKAFCLEGLLNQEPGEAIRMDTHEAGLVRSRIGDVLKSRNEGSATKQPIYWIDAPTMDLSRMAQVEGALRKQHDPYDEWKTRIITWAESLAQE